jgi:hypothetical protein
VGICGAELGGIYSCGHSSGIAPDSLFSKHPKSISGLAPRTLKGS